MGRAGKFAAQQKKMKHEPRPLPVPFNWAEVPFPLTDSRTRDLLRVLGIASHGIERFNPTSSEISYLADLERRRLEQIQDVQAMNRLRMASPAHWAALRGLTISTHCSYESEMAVKAALKTLDQIRAAA